MAFLLLFITCFQFLATCIGLQQSPIYFVINPYALLAPFIFIWLAALAFYKQAPDKNFIIVWLIVASVQIMVIGAFRNSDDFPFNFIRSLQFFWGPALLTPMLLGLFRLSDSPPAPLMTAQKYIWWLCILAASVTLLEVLLVTVIGISPARLPWVTNIYPGPHRPFGLVAYPQPNAVMLAILFWISFLYKVPGPGHKILLALALPLTHGATGALTFLAMVPLWTRRPFLFSVSGAGLLAALIGYATLSQQYATGGALEKFDVAYSSILLKMFTRVFESALSHFSMDDIIFGSPVISSAATTGLTHDWAYFDVFYVAGISGVVGYTALYGILAFLACPREQPRSMRFYFTLALMLANFHYGTVNYFIGQMFFSTLAALNIYRSYKASRAPSPEQKSVIA